MTQTSASASHQELIQDITQELSRIGQPYGLELNTVVKRNKEALSIAVTMTLPGKSATLLPKAVLQDRDEWEDLAELYGVPADWLGQLFEVNGHTYQILGFSDTRESFSCRDMQSGKSANIPLHVALGLTGSLPTTDPGFTSKPGQSKSKPSPQLKSQLEDIRQGMKDWAYVCVVLADGTNGTPDKVRISPDGRRLQGRLSPNKPYQDIIDYDID